MAEPEPIKIIESGTFTARINKAPLKEKVSRAYDIIGLDYGCTGPEFLNEILDAAIMKAERRSTSLESDVKKIEELKKAIEHNGEVFKQIEKAKAELEEKNAELKIQLDEKVDDTGLINDLNQTILDKDAAIEDLENRIEQLEKTKSELADKTKRHPNELRIILSDECRIYLEITSKRLSEKQDKEVTPAELMQDLFIQYVEEQENMFSFPFMLTKREINAIKAKLNQDNADDE